MSNTPETHETPSSPAAAAPDAQTQQTAAAAETSRPAVPDRKYQRSVIFYISILFVAAFLLLSMSLMMERRQHAENLDDLNQSLTGLKDSVSAMQSVQKLYEENTALLERVAELETQLKDAAAETDRLTQSLADQEKANQAMDWFWQIDEAYVRSRWVLARSLVQQMKDAGLESYLPQESFTDNGRFSPADRYQEICDRIF